VSIFLYMQLFIPGILPLYSLLNVLPLKLLVNMNNFFSIILYSFTTFLSLHFKILHSRNFFVFIEEVRYFLKIFL